MSAKKTKRVDVKTRINSALNTTKRAVKNSNEFALNTTEGFVTESLIVAEQWQKVTKKAISGGFKLAANQQDLVFEALEAMKGQYAYGRKKVTKFFA